MLHWFSKIGDFFVLSILWLLCCLPVLTFIPGCIALYDSVAHCVLGEEEGSLSRFFRTLKKELLRGMLLSVVWAAIGFVLFYGYSILYQMGKESPAMAAYSLVYLFTMLIPLGILGWLIPVESRFEYRFLELFRVSAIYAILHLPTTILMLVCLIVALVIVSFLPVLGLLLPGITVTVQCRFVEKVFSKYIPQEEDTADEQDV